MNEEAVARARAGCSVPASHHSDSAWASSSSRIQLLVMMCLLAGIALPVAAVEYKVTETDDEIRIETGQIEAAVRKVGYVSGVARQSFLDKQSGYRDPGFGLDIVYDAWCHQRGYVCMIQEFGGRPIRAGQSFSAAFIVGYFDSIDEMHRVYDRYKGATVLSLTESSGWQLSAAASEAARKD